MTLGVSARGVALAAGTYRAADPFTVPFTITLPAGYETNSFSTGEVSVANGAGGYGLTLDLIQNVFVDPCHTQGPMPSPAPTTVGELVPLLTHMVGFTAGPVADDIIGGHPAKSFKLTNTVDTATAACTGGPLLPLWTFRGGPATGAATNGGVSLLIWVTDVGGTPLIIASDSDATNLDAKRAEIGAVVHSIQFDD